MGEKRKRRGKYFLSLSALCMIFMVILAGCQVMFRRAAVVSGGTAETGPLEENSAETKDRESEMQPEDCPLLDQAESHEAAGEYPLAMDAVARAVATCNDGDERNANRALGIMIRSMAHIKSQKNDVHTIMGCFVNPGLPLPDQGAAARCWISVLDELMALSAEVTALKSVTASQRNRIEALKRQIEQLKAVDLELGTPEPEMDEAGHE